jgi:TusA-related sulfurtransferase
MAGSKESATGDVSTLVAASTLDLLEGSENLGAVCATLTPAIKARLAELQIGQILLVRVDDPSARLDVPAWCALTGNVLQAVAQEDGGIFDFFIKKESKR